MGAALLWAIASFSSETRAQFTGNYQTNSISGVGSNWAADYVVGSNCVLDALIIRNGGGLSSGNGYIEYGIGGSNDSVLVTGAGSVWSNGGDLFVGYLGPNNALTVSGGGAVYNGVGYLGYGSYFSNAVAVSDSGSVWSNRDDLYIGWCDDGDRLIVTNGGAVYNAGGHLGFCGPRNAVQVSGPGSVWCNQGTLCVGELSGGSNNTLLVSGGGTVLCGWLYVGHDSGTSSNTVVLSDPGSSLVYTGWMTVGYLGVDNQLIITNGAQVLGRYEWGASAFLGGLASSTNNSVLVSDRGSMWSNDCLFIGDGSGNRLTISNGGVVFGCGWIGCGQTDANNNVAIVTGVGSAWIGSVSLDSGGDSSNLFLISSGGVAYGSGSTIGNSKPGSHNVAIV